MWSWIPHKRWHRLLCRGRAGKVLGVVSWCQGTETKIFVKRTVVLPSAMKDTLNLRQWSLAYITSMAARLCTRRKEFGKVPPPGDPSARRFARWRMGKDTPEAKSVFCVKAKMQIRHARCRCSTTQWKRLACGSLNKLKLQLWNWWWVAGRSTCRCWNETQWRLSWEKCKRPWIKRSTNMAIAERSQQNMWWLLEISMASSSPSLLFWTKSRSTTRTKVSKPLMNHPFSSVIRASSTSSSATMCNGVKVASKCCCFCWPTRPGLPSHVILDTKIDRISNQLDVGQQLSRVWLRDADLRDLSVSRLKHSKIPVLVSSIDPMILKSETISLQISFSMFPKLSCWTKKLKCSFKPDHLQFPDLIDYSLNSFTFSLFQPVLLSGTMPSKPDPFARQRGRSDSVGWCLFERAGAQRTL